MRKNYAPRTGERLGLKNDLERKLHVEGFSRPDTRGAVEVADRIGGDAETTAIGAARRRQIRAVEEVKHFDTELRADAFPDLGVLHDREVHGGITRSIERVTSAVPLGSGSRICKSGL